MVLNCDLVLADERARFALPEVKRGVVAIQGGGFVWIFFFFWWGRQRFIPGSTVLTIISRAQPRAGNDDDDDDDVGFIDKVTPRTDGRRKEETSSCLVSFWFRLVDSTRLVSPFSLFHLLA